LISVKSKFSVAKDAEASFCTEAIAAFSLPSVPAIETVEVSPGLRLLSYGNRRSSSEELPLSLAQCGGLY
jgi:hypothetical protein